MPIKFVQEKKKQKYLILVFVAVLLIIGIVLWFGFFKKEPSVSPVAFSVSLREIKIDFELLESSAFKELQPFGEISSFEEKTGRNNPFLPYGTRLEFEPEPET